MRDRLFELYFTGRIVCGGYSFQPRAPTKLLYASHELVQTNCAFLKVLVILLNALNTCNVTSW